MLQFFLDFTWMSIAWCVDEPVVASALGVGDDVQFKVCGWCEEWQYDAFRVAVGMVDCTVWPSASFVLLCVGAFTAGRTVLTPFLASPVGETLETLDG